ncbi:MAG: aminoacyl-tRNA hydrolase [Porticoccaceae bacterium]|nr:aminoacyl-tRNA hydrolase [Porticoccaceae bacterium]
MDTPVKLIVGLGNPGSQYDRTRHNAGADFVSALVRRHNVELREAKKFFGLAGKLTLQGRDIRLLIPTTYMNRSGQSVAALANFYSLAPAEILVAHDELDLPPGVARLKIGGGHGGHNGLRDTIQSLANSRDFARLRLGIGHPGHASQVVDYVLRRAPDGEQKLLEQAIDAALYVLPQLAAGRWNDAMKALHSR